jgi:sn-1 stearoyl-lipid 9-desaturase
MYAIGIFLLQIAAYISIIPMIMYADWYHYLIALFMYFMNGCLGMIMGYHRLLTHRSFECPIWFERFITLCATIGLTGPAIDWVAIHKAHHRFSDTEKDPHSPDHLGVFRVHFLTMFAKVNIKYAGSLLRDKFLLFQRKYYFVLNLIYATVLFFADPFALIYAWLFPAAVLILLGTSVLSINHRNSKPHNSIIHGLLTWGDGFHETHHDNPNKKRLHKYDICGYLIEKWFA